MFAEVLNLSKCYVIVISDDVSDNGDIAKWVKYVVELSEFYHAPNKFTSQYLNPVPIYGPLNVVSRPY